MLTQERRAKDVKSDIPSYFEIVKFPLNFQNLPEIVKIEATKRMTFLAKRCTISKCTIWGWWFKGTMQRHKASQGITGHHKASQGITRHHKVSQDITKYHKVSQGLTRHHMVSQKYHKVSQIIIWQAPRTGKMRGILCSDWLPERAR